MKKLLALAICLSAGALLAQTTSNLVGTVTDPTGGVIASAKVSAKNLETNAVKDVTTDGTGFYRVVQLTPGTYELTVEAPGFQKYVQRPITVRLNQDVDVSVQLKVGALNDVVTITGDAALINTTNAEVGVNFDSTRITNLPLAPNRNILNAALSVAGVSQLSNGNSGFADGGVSFSVNGSRTRSNNFMLDGGDINSPSVGGASQQINNPDTVAELQLITNQFKPEYGRASGSVVNVVTKSGSNQFHGSGAWFNNNNHFNSRSNLDERNPAFANGAPFRNENQVWVTLGGPVKKDKTFFYVSALRWTDRQFASGTSIGAAPTQEGKDILNRIAGNRPQVKALLDFLPAAQAPAGTVTAAVNGVTSTIPTGILSGAAPNLLNAWQWSARADHRFSDKQNLFVRYQADTRETVSGQAVPPGLTSEAPTERNIAVAALNSSLTPTLFNEVRVSFNRQNTATNAADQSSLNIPSIEVSALGLTGFNAAASRTAIGLALNLPQSGTLNNYQIVDNISWLKGSHSFKAGIDFRRQDQFSVFNPTLRGRLAYGSLQNLIDDEATVAQINSPLPGVPTKQYYKYYDYFFYVQDEWKTTKRLTLTYGLRFESPGNALDLLQDLNDIVVRNRNNDPAFRVDPLPGRDKNNWAPRFGFNYRFGKAPGILGWLTGEENLVLRGGYSRTYDLIFNNMALNVFSSFPFTVITNPSPSAAAGNRIPNAFATIDPIRAGRVLPTITNPMLIPRTIVDTSFRAPVTEQFSMQFQRSLASDWAWTLGWVGTKGTALFQSLDGNPTVPGTGGLVRVNNSRGVIRHRANSASSIYHSLQTSLEKRLRANFAAGVHYTWSSFLDDASEVFNASNAGEVAVPQDSYNRRSDRGRSTYDRPHRLSFNATWEVPFFRNQKNIGGYVLGGWQLSALTTFQSGSPYSPLSGNVDPGNRLTGIDGLVGNSIRPFVATNLDLTAMTPEELFGARGTPVTGNGAPNLFRQVTAAAPLGDAGRNILRADGIGNVDFALNKSFIMPWREGHKLNYRLEMYNMTNTRNFGIPNANINNTNFANQWLTDGGNRRIVMGLRYSF